MTALHNRISRKELKELIKNDPTPRIPFRFIAILKLKILHNSGMIFIAS